MGSHLVQYGVLLVAAGVVGKLGLTWFLSSRPDAPLPESMRADPDDGSPQ